MRPSLSSKTKETDRLYTLRQIAHKGHISIKTVRRLIARGDLPTHRIGRQIRISEADWQAFLERTREAK